MRNSQVTSGGSAEKKSYMDYLYLLRIDIIILETFIFNKVQCTRAVY